MTEQPTSPGGVIRDRTLPTDTSVDATMHEVRQIASSNGPTGDLAPLAATYFSLCRDFNERLRTAVAWKRRGLFVEARHHAEQAPDALIAAAKLDLGEHWARWSEICMAAGVPVDLPIDASLGVELSQAYAEWAPREQLLIKLRLEALGRAPLRQRLATLYQLRVADPDNSNWTEQVQELERARAREMVQEADAARRAGDVAALRELLKEAQHGPWQAGSPQRAVASVTAAASKAVGLSSSRRLHELAEQMHQAHGNADGSAVGELLAEWRAIIGAGEAQPTPEDAAEVDPIAAWWDARNAEAMRNELAQRLTAELDAALSDGLPWPTITGIHRSLEDTQVPIPATLIRRFEVRAEEHRRAVAARHRLIAIATCLLLLIAAGGLWWGISAYSRSKQVESLRAGLQTALADNNLPAARPLVETVRTSGPRISTHPSLTPLLAQYDEASRLASQNDDAFAAALAKLAAARGGLEDHAAQITQAEKLARSPEQKAALERERTRLLAERQAHFDDADREFVRAVDELIARCESALLSIGEKLDANTPGAQLGGDIAALFQQLNELDATIRQKTASDAQRSEKDVQAAAIRKRAAAYRERADRDTRLATKLEKIGAFRGGLGELALAYKDLLQEFPEGPVARRLDDALKHAPAWATADAWITGYSAWAPAWTPPTDAAAASRAAELEAIVGSMGSGFNSPSAREYLEYLNRMKTLLADPREAASVMGWREMIQKPRLLELQIVYDVNGVPSRTIGGTLTANERAGWFQLSEAIVSQKKFEELERPAAALVELGAGIDPAKALGPAPEATLARQMLAALTACEKGDANWNTLSLQLAVLIQNATDADPIFRANLAFYALTRQFNAGWPFQGDIEASKAIIDDLQSSITKPLTQDWFASAPASIAARERCSKALKSLPDLAPLLKSSEQRLLDLKVNLRAPQFAGLIWASADGPREYKGQQLSGSVIIISLGTDDRVNLLEVGTMKSGVITWTAPIPPVGTPILIKN